MFVLNLSAILLPEMFLILRIIQQGIVISVHMSSCKVPIVPVRF